CSSGGGAGRAISSSQPGGRSTGPSGTKTRPSKRALTVLMSTSVVEQGAGQPVKAAQLLRFFHLGRDCAGIPIDRTWSVRTVAPGSFLMTRLIVCLCLLLLPMFSTLGPAATAEPKRDDAAIEKVVAASMEAARKMDWQAYAELIHPESLEDYKKMWLPVLTA